MAGPSDVTPGTVEEGRRLGWRGRRAKKVIRHRWQKDWSGQPLERMQRREYRRRLKTGLLLAAFAGLVAFLIYYLLSVPAQTPVIAVAAPAYDSPIPPNAWSHEDLDGLKALHGHTLSVVDVSEAWRSKERGLRHFQLQLRNLAKTGSHTGAAVIYLSMHGVVDGEGRPCLVPPGASPLRSESWLRLDDLLEIIKDQNLPDDLYKLVILDSTRMQVNWNLGLLYNSFADGLPEAVREAAIPNLVVLNATSPGQVAWASAGLEGSVFGHFLRRGLAGAADDEAQGGDGNQRVTLHELHRYLRHHVDGWVKRNRADRQQPMLIPYNAPDFKVAWTVNRWTRRRLEEQTAEGGAQPAVSFADLAELWRARDEFLELDPMRFDPLAWRDLEHKLLWLEQAAFAGEAYRDAALRTYAELQAHLAEIEARAAEADDERSLHARWDVFSERPVELPRDLRLHTIPLARYFGRLSPETAADLDSALARFREAPTATSLDEALVPFAEHGARVPLAEGHFLRMVKRFGVPRLWDDPEALSRAVGMLLRAEELAVPADERAQYWSRALVEHADGVRREAEDLLFVASPEALAQASQRWSEADGLYQDAAARTEAVAEALRIRDRAWSRLPYLAQWLSRNLREGVDAAPADKIINDRLKRLIDDTHELGAAIAAHGALAADPAAEPAFISHARKVEEQLRRLERLLASEVETLLADEKPGAATLRDIEEALRVPLLTAEQRDDLLRIAEQIDDRLASGYEPTAALGADDADGTDGERHGADYLYRTVIAWGTHPALAILSRDALEEPADEETAAQEAPEGNERAISAANGRSVRRLLLAIPREAREYADLSAAAAEEPETGDDATGREGWSRAERLVRAAGSFWFPRLDEDPVDQVRRFDLQQLLAWNAARAIDDFWGPAQPGGPAFFELAGADHLDAARILLSPSPAEPRLAGLQARLERRRLAARDGLKTTAPDLPLGGVAENLQTTVYVRSGSSVAAESLPPGEAAVFLQDWRGRLADTSRPLPMPLVTDEPPAGSVALSYTLPGGVLGHRGPMVEAVTLFRGHAFSSAFMLRPAGGVKIDFRRHEYGPPKVTLSGRTRKKASVIFVVDCSDTMRQMTTIEAPGEQRRISRMEAAKLALRRMLNRLAVEGDARVGVIFFGHRVGWNLQMPDQLLRQDRYTGEIPDDLLPSEDVETVLTLGEFGTVEAGRVSDRLQSVRPWGESPVYLALVEAMQAFRNEDPQAKKTIIAITDGANYQFNSPDPQTVADVLEARDIREVSVNLVGFDVAEEENSDARAEFQQLAEETGGSYVPAAGATGLVRRLEDLLGPSTYRILDSEDEAVAQAEVGQQVTITPKPAKPRPYTVAVESLAEPVVLAGGEALELVIARDGQGIEALPYLDPALGRLLTGGDPRPSGCLAGVHRPDWVQGGVRFPISLQRDDRRFTPRLPEIWIEVAPLFADRRASPRKYIFYDASYEPNKPVPVLNWLAEDWPLEAKRAAVRVWCKPQMTPPDDSVSLAEASAATPEGGEGSAIRGVPGVTYTVHTRRPLNPEDPYRIGIVERHGDESPGIDAVKVEMQPPADRIVHRFDTENRRVIHEFFYDRIDDQLMGGYEIRFTSRRAVHDGAWHLEEPIVVDVSSAGDVIRLVPASGAR